MDDPGQSEQDTKEYCGRAIGTVRILGVLVGEIYGGQASPWYLPVETYRNDLANP